MNLHKMGIIRYALVLFFMWATVTALNGRQGPVFMQEPPNRVDFANTTGTVIQCSAQGNPTPSLSWLSGDNEIPVSDVPGLRHVRPDGSLVFLPFRPEEFRPDVHDNVYSCVASSIVGTIVSRQIRVKGVVQQSYTVDVYDEFVIRGNTAVLRCNIPGLVRDYVSVTSWIQDGTFVIRPTALAGDRFSVFPEGELHVRRVEPSDSLKQFVCETRHSLTGETVMSSTSGRLLLTETFRNVPPRITDSKRLIKGTEGDPLEVPCASQGHPPPSYKWYRKDQDGTRMLPLLVGHRLLQLDGTLVARSAKVTDSGHYVCKVNNSAGSDSAETEILITAPLTAQISPRSRTVDVGKPAVFNCSSGGNPISRMVWRKDGRLLRTGNQRIQFPSRNVLSISAAHRKDKGMYQCFVNNEFDSAQGTAELKLGDYPPVLTETFEEITTDPGPPFSLKCVALGSPLPQITWSLDGATIPEKGGLRMGDYVRSDSTVVSFVNITSSRLEDGGYYECTAQNDVGRVTHGARVNIYGSPFVRRMGNISVVAGDNLRVQCPVGGHPIKSIQWEKQGSRLPANHRQKVFPNGTLLLRNVDSSSDEGEYSCLASNKEGISARNSLHLFVMVKPQVEPFTFPKTLQEEQRFSVLCTVTKGDAPVLIRWFKNSHLVPKGNKIHTVKVTEFSSSLVFDSLSREHSGNYSCEASNRAGTDSQASTMVIHVAPRWRVEPSDQSITKGNSAVVDCQAEGYPSPRIRWTKAGNAGADFRPISSSSRLHVFENGSLVLHDIQEEDSGLYLCQATNGIGQGLSKVIKVSVHVAAHFKRKFHSQTVRKGEEAKLRCDAVGDKPIRLTWLKDKQPFEPSLDPRYELTETVLSGGTTSELTIRRSDRRESALFTCIASNGFGRDDTNIQLTMQEPPDAPQDVKVIELGSRSVKLGWSPPFSGNSPITQYVLRHKKDVDDWHQDSITNLTVPGTESIVTVRSLHPITSYHFQLSAVNSLGTSEPSHVVQIKTKEEAPGGPPQKVKAYATGAHSVKVAWKPPRKDLQFGILRGYYVGYKVADSKESFIYKTLEVNSEEDSNFMEETQLLNLQRDTKYAVIVQAFNSKGAGPPSDQVFTQTHRNDPPTSPALQVTFTNRSAIILSWEPNPAEDNPIEGYVLHQKIDVSNWKETELSPDQREAFLSELRCGYKYQYYITAYNSVGRGTPSDIVRARTDGIPPVAPDRHSLLNAINETSVALRLDTWHDGGCPISSFIIKYRPQRKPLSWIELPSNSDVFNDGVVVLKDLTPGTWYQLQVTATNEAGSTDAEYTFVTASDGGTRTVLLDSGEVSDIVQVPFYLDVNILVPTAVSSAVVIALLIVVCIIAGSKHRRSSSNARRSDSYGSTLKCQVHESVPLSEVEKNSLKKTLSSGPAPATANRTDYFPTPYATTRVSSAEQELQLQQQNEARMVGCSADEPLYATVKRTPRLPRSDIHIYHYPGEIPDMFLQEGDKILSMEDLGASTSHWREEPEIHKDRDFASNLADFKRSSGKPFCYSQR